MRWFETERGRDCAALGLIAVVLLGLLWPVTFGGKLMLPADMLMVMQPWKEHSRDEAFTRVHTPFLDSIQQAYPWRKFAAEQMRQGTIPLWNPYMFCGSPFVANNQSACFYPETWLFMLMPPEHAFGWAALLSLMMGGTFMFYFLRLLGLRRTSAVVGTIPFLLCGFLVGWMLLPTVRAVPMWLPLMLLAFERCLRSLSSPFPLPEGPGITRPAVLNVTRIPSAEPPTLPTVGRVIPGPSNEPLSRRSTINDQRSTPFLWASLCALAIGLQFLAGHLHVSLFILIIFGAYVVSRLIQTVRAGECRAAFLGAVAVAASLFTGVLLAMLQLLPVLELVGMNPRKAGQTFEAVKGNAMIPAYLFAGLMPDLFGNPVDYNFWGSSLFSTAREYIETVWYIGVPTLLLIVVAIAFRKSAWGKFSTCPPRSATAMPSQVTFWAAVWLGGAGMAWGTVLYWVLFHLIPPLRQLPGISRAVLICDFSGAILAGMGFEAISRKLEASDPHAIRRVIDRTALVLGLLAIAAGVTAWLYTGQLENTMPGVGNYTLSQLLRCLALILGTVAAVAVMTWTVRPSEGTIPSEGTALAVPRPVKRSSEGTPLTVPRPGKRTSRGTAKAVPSGQATAPCVPPARVVWGKALLIAVLALDLLLFASHFLPAVPARYLHVKSEALDRMREDTSLYRMTSLIGDGKGIDRMPPNLTMAFGFQDVQGSDSLLFEGYQTLMGLIPLDKKGNPDPTSPILDMLNCKYLLTSQDLSRTPGWKLVTDYETNVYANTQVLPRAFVAGKVEQATPEQALAKMKTGFDPARVTYLSGVMSGLPVCQRPLSVSVSDYQANSVTVNGPIPAYQLLVLSDIWYPGWHAYGDDREQPLLRANYALRGTVNCAVGAKQVRFVYYPACFAAGAFLSCLAVMFIACGLVIGWRRR